MKNETRVTIVISNFNNAVAKLNEFLASPIEDDRDRAGIIQAFEFCYELAWKSLKKIAEEKGLESPTPLDAFQAGFQMGLIKDDEHSVWLDMKKTRNLTSHTYKEDLAKQVLGKIQSDYVTIFEKLLGRIKENE